MCTCRMASLLHVVPQISAATGRCILQVQVPRTDSVAAIMPIKFAHTLTLQGNLSLHLEVPAPSNQPALLRCLTFTVPFVSYVYNACFPGTPGS